MGTSEELTADKIEASIATLEPWLPLNQWPWSYQGKRAIEVALLSLRSELARMREAEPDCRRIDRVLAELRATAPHEERARALITKLNGWQPSPFDPVDVEFAVRDIVAAFVQVEREAKAEPKPAPPLEAIATLRVVVEWVREREAYDLDEAFAALSELESHLKGAGR